MIWNQKIVGLKLVCVCCEVVTSEKALDDRTFHAAAVLVMEMCRTVGPSSNLQAIAKTNCFVVCLTIKISTVSVQGYNLIATAT